MNDAASPVITPDEAESRMRFLLARGDAQVATIDPILRHLVASENSSFFSEEIVARTRAMIEDVARQLLVNYRESSEEPGPEDVPAESVVGLAACLAGDKGLLRHVHALSLEWQLTERLQARVGLDPLLSPMLQALISSSDASTSGLAMKLLAAQARFSQSQRRMQLPLGELPADLLHSVLQVWTSSMQEAALAEHRIREGFDESRSRIGLLARIVLGMGGSGAVATLDIADAGAALFLTGLAMANGRDRAMMALAMHESQTDRLALELAAAGLGFSVIAKQFQTLHPEVSPPEGLQLIGPDRAAALLGEASYST